VADLSTGRPKTEIGGNMGFFGRFTDSEGNIQGVYEKAA